MKRLPGDSGPFQSIIIKIQKTKKQKKTKHRNSLLLFYSSICEPETIRISGDPKKKGKNIITNESKKKTKLGTGRKKSKKQEEEKPKKFQFIHSLNKYNIRYGVFMYIIHFQRNVHSMNGLWCEKSL
jgi:hypothetical protein